MMPKLDYAIFSEYVRKQLEKEATNENEMRAEERIFNMYRGLAEQLRLWLARLGVKSIPDLVGRTEYLEHLDYLARDEDLAEQGSAPARGEARR